MRAEKELRLHTGVLMFVIGVMTTVIWVIVRYVEPRSGGLGVFGSFAFTAIVVIFSSSFIYEFLTKTLITILSRVAPRLLHGESYVHGVWIGEIEGGSRTIAVEQYKQTLSSLSIRGRAFWPDGTKAAEWRSSLAAIDPAGPRILAMFRSTIFNDAGHVVRDTRGFGELELDGGRITGVVIDRPEIRADGQAIPKMFHYKLERSRCKDLGEAESSDQFKCLLQQHGQPTGGAG